jgi:hypothetical protein
MLTLRPATYIETISRSLLLSLGFDRVTTEFFVATAVGAFAVLMTMIFVGAGIPRRRQVTSRKVQR